MTNYDLMIASKAKLTADSLEIFLERVSDKDFADSKALIAKDVHDINTNLAKLPLVNDEVVALRNILADIKGVVECLRVDLDADLTAEEHRIVDSTYINALETVCGKLHDVMSRKDD